jgi:hypothetical protein
MDIISVEHHHFQQIPFLLLSIPSDLHDHRAKIAAALLPIPNTSAGNHGLRSVEVIACVHVSIVQICKDISAKELLCTD